jgi:hypothetical protein
MLDPTAFIGDLHLWLSTSPYRVNLLAALLGHLLCNIYSLLAYVRIL